MPFQNIFCYLFGTFLLYHTRNHLSSIFLTFFNFFCFVVFISTSLVHYYYSTFCAICQEVFKLFFEIFSSAFRTQWVSTNLVCFVYPLLTLFILLHYNPNCNRQNAQRIKRFQDFFVQFAGRPCGRKNTVML